MKKTRELAYIAVYAAMFVVLDRVQIYRLPNGGSINLSTIALLLASYHLGWKAGLVAGLTANLLLFVTGSLHYYGLVSLFFDYLIPYTILGGSSFFKNYGYFYSGILITGLIRLASSTFSGIVVWDTEFWASLGYNATYIIPVIIIDLLAVPAIYKAIQPVIDK